MNINSKITAFTMIDMLTGMVVMSIIIAMVFYLFTALNGQVFKYGQVHNELNRYLMMRMDMNRQCDLADEIVAIPNGIELLNEDKGLIYQTEGNLLFRISEHTIDTLCTDLIDLKYKYQTNETSKNKELINEIELQVSIQEQILTCRIFKNYDPQSEMNLELLNEF